MTDDQFKQASDFLRQVHKNVRSYWTDTTDMPIKSKKDTDEGISTWVCGYVLFKDAPGDADKAYDYLNAINDPEVAKVLVKDWGYGQANAKGMAGVDPAVLKEKGYDNVEKWVDKTLFQPPLPSGLKQRMVAEFEKIKAGY